MLDKTKEPKFLAKIMEHYDYLFKKKKKIIMTARVYSHVSDFNTRNKLLTAKLLNQGYRYHKLRKAFSKFYRRHFDLVSKFNVGQTASATRPIGT